MAFITGKRYPKLALSTLRKSENISMERKNLWASLLKLDVMFSDVKCSLGRINGSKNQSLPNKDLKLMRKIHNWRWGEFLERLHTFLKWGIDGHLLTMRHKGKSGKQGANTWVKHLWTFVIAEGNEDGENTRKVFAVSLVALPKWAMCPVPGQYGIWILP